MRPRRTDRNHQEIVQALRQAGALVKDVSGCPGCLDAIVAYGGRLVWLEIKDGEKSSSRRQLTKPEAELIAGLLAVGAPVYVVTSVDEALRAIEAVAQAQAVGKGTKGE